MPRKKSTATRVAAYALAFLIPPLIVGIVLGITNVSQVMIHKQPKLPEGLNIATLKPAHLSQGRKKFKALILTSNAGTQITDLLAPYEILSQSGLFEVFTAAPERVLSSTTASVAFVPDYSLKDAPAADLLVVPAVLDFNNEYLIRWVKEHARQFRTILAPCEGSRILAQTGLLKGRTATSHFMAIEDLKKLTPDVNWVSDQRYVPDSKYITSAGVTASLDATLYAVELFGGKKLAEETAKKMHLASHLDMDPEERGFTRSELFWLIIRSGYEWNRRSVGVVLYPGVSELGAAAALDTLPRALSTRVFSVAMDQPWLQTRHGVNLVAVETIPDSPPADVALIPSADSPTATAPLNVQAFKNWVIDHRISVKTFIHEPVGKAFPQSLELLGILSGTDDIWAKRFVSKMIEYPSAHAENSEIPAAVLMRALAVGLIGLFAVWMIDLRLRK